MPVLGHSVCIKDNCDLLIVFFLWFSRNNLCKKKFLIQTSIFRLLVSFLVLFPTVRPFENIVEQKVFGSE
jgi:hypothetical protein